MKVSLLLITVILAYAASYPTANDAKFLKLEENSKDSEWTLIPDGDGNFNLVNMRELDLEQEIQPRVPILITFRLFTASNMYQGTEQFVELGNPVSLIKSNFNPDYPTRIICHGWKNSATSSINSIITAEYLNRGKFNVFVVDWSSASSSTNYIYSRRRVPEVGQRIADFVDFLHTDGGLKFETLTLIGHSLGAHASGLAGKYVKTGRVNTIMALDPALPLFSMDKPDDRVDAADAEYVESIHTNGGLLSIPDPIGHASFYPNYGRRQPGCGLDAAGACSHSRSYEYFAETLQENNMFVAMECSTYGDIKNKTCNIRPKDVVKMGGEPSNHDRKLRGIFYMETNSKAPFGLGLPQ